MKNKPNSNFNKWWNDGESRFKKSMFLFTSWWEDGSSKLIKAIFVSLVFHLIFAIFWFLYNGINYLI